MKYFLYTNYAYLFIYQALGNYRFSYSVTNNEGEQFRNEGTDNLGRVIGSYGLKHVDGTHRVVDYVADKDGFRASVRSNEPGVASAEPADAPIVKTVGGDPPLTVAATSNDDARAVFGKRLQAETPRVTYVSPVEPKAPDETVRESRQYNFDDYRPLSPVAYYPGEERSPTDLQTPPARRPVESQRTPRVLQQVPEADSKPIDVYFPPIDPHSARRPPYYPSRDRSSDRNLYPTTTSRRPFIPPYGGFDDDPVPESRRPGISMTTIHGGFEPRLDFPTRAPIPVNRFPPIGHSPDQRDFTRAQFPPSSNFPSAIPPPSSGILPSFPRGIPPPQNVLFNPPSYDNGIGSPNFELRSVPIPNGIQAVRADPNSGRIYERVMYPIYLRHNGYPAYDKNILLHNDDLGDDDASRDFDNSGNFDIPFPNDSPFRGTRNPSFGAEEDRPGRSRRYNGTYVIDERNLSEPTASDMAWVQRQLSQIEGFERDAGFDNRVSSDSPFRDPSFRINADSPPFRNNRPSSRIRSFNDRIDFDDSNIGTFSRNPRNSDVLSVEDTNQHNTKVSETSAHSKQIETEGNSSSLEKE